MVKILVVEDDENFNSLVSRYLASNGFEVISCADAQKAYDALYNNLFDLIVTDVMMPGIDGVEFAKTVRQLNENIPILFVTARDDIKTKKAGFRVGIDDYLVKPIDLDELKLRISAVLRRANISQNQKIEIGNLLLKSEEISASINGVPIPLTVREFNILFKMLSFAGRAFSRAEFLDDFWDTESNASLRAVDVYITKLREKFKSTNAFEIKTIHGLGYKTVIRS
ncbi:response regulator transcription factor [Oenococcus oeni]|uniref:response regulator transcription factor n=1 Tax=Oenococcus oeni TaxID=1247 RepID=UPI000277B539|nr:response regulator transcription factor [Oenococcus oeni]EJO05433.1 DNA-binding response regulator [Oenococcus oeni AWRIB548]EJO07409.1 DNA-binding response regulator [Oenococcus oeni AWRIB422]KEP85833.1 transcriptional regulator [Oenococcus oeni IOEB_0205]KGH67103.1 regulator [Oenococcus oeni IOEB_B16]KGH95763.1 regulator [Oenococcus oeni IOEB_S450]